MSKNGRLILILSDARGTKMVAGAAKKDRREATNVALPNQDVEDRIWGNHPVSV
jgi:hypothetical protein